MDPQYQKHNVRTGCGLLWGKVRRETGLRTSDCNPQITVHNHSRLHWHQIPWTDHTLGLRKRKVRNIDALVHKKSIKEVST